MVPYAGFVCKIPILYRDRSLPLLSEEFVAEFIDEDQSAYTSDKDYTAQGHMCGWMIGWMDHVTMYLCVCLSV